MSIAMIGPERGLGCEAAQGVQKPIGGTFDCRTNSVLYVIIPSILSGSRDYKF